MNNTLEEAYEDEYKYKEEYNDKTTIYPQKAKVSSGTINPTYSNDAPLLHTRDLFYDNVTNPSHYVAGRKYEPWDVIDDWKLNYFLGNAIKYIARADRKGNKMQDLEKAIQYIQKERQRS